MTIDSRSQTAQAWRNVDRYSGMFLSSPPDAMGFLSDHVLPEVFAQYMAQASPGCRPFVNQFIGTSHRTAPVDIYGNSVAAHPQLPGYGHGVLHTQIKQLLGDMANAAHLHSVWEAANIFHGRVPEPYITDYCNVFTEAAQGGRTRGRDAIIPDLLIHDYPLDRTELGQDGVAARTGVAILEVKGVRLTNTTYPVRSRAADTRATKVRREYTQKARSLDHQFAPDLTMDPTDTSVRRTGPFERAMSTFVSGGPIPCVVGAFGETNAETDALLRTLALHAASTQDGLSISPHSNLHHRHGAYPILLQQFRRALGLAAVRSHAELKLRRLHFIRPTPEEASAAAQRHHRDCPRTDRFSATSPHWFSNNVGDQYHAFHQFCFGRSTYSCPRDRH